MGRLMKGVVSERIRAPYKDMKNPQIPGVGF